MGNIRRSGHFTSFLPTRRQALSLAASAASSLLIPKTVFGAPAWNPPNRVIDVHCHVFNGRDVPASNFVFEVAAREGDAGPIIRRMAAFLVSLIEHIAPDFKTEEDKYKLYGGKPDELVAALTLSDELLQSHIVHELTILSRNSSFSKQKPFKKTEFTTRLESFGLQTDEADKKQNDVYLNDQGRALSDILTFYGQSGAIRPPAASLELPKSKKNAQFAPSLEPFVAANAFNSVAKGMVTDSHKSETLSVNGKVGALIRFAKRFLAYRLENLIELDRAFALGSANVRLYTPACVDYDYWLGANGTTPMIEQVRIIAHSAKHLPSNILVNSFVAFDPLRSIVEKHVRPEAVTSSAQDTVERAIIDFGCIGVKLYPPMGFQATGNAMLSGRDFGPKAAKLGLKGELIGSKLDDELDWLYRFCLRYSVPIMAHCANSQTSLPGFGLRADPTHWLEVLSKPPAIDAGGPINYSELRLNLAHFGSIWCASKEKRGKDETERCETLAGKAWPQNIVDMIAAVDGNRPRYPNVYFDLADVSILATASPDADAFIDEIAKIFMDRDKANMASKHLLYGTDWMFMSINPTFPKFPFGIHRLAEKLGVSDDDLFWRNAANFLGLTKNGMTTKRLRDFYGNDKKRRDALESIVVEDGIA